MDRRKRRTGMRGGRTLNFVVVITNSGEDGKRQGQGCQFDRDDDVS